MSSKTQKTKIKSGSSAFIVDVKLKKRYSGLMDVNKFKAGKKVQIELMK